MEQIKARLPQLTIVVKRMNHKHKEGSDTTVLNPEEERNANLHKLRLNRG